MSGVLILKNVCYFAEILNFAISKQLRKWDDFMLQRAISWAKYCEQVHILVQQQGCRDSMNSKLHQLVVLSSPASLLRLNFDSLMKATHLLIEIILRNPYGTSDLHRSLEGFVGKDKWHEVSERVKGWPAVSSDLGLFYLPLSIGKSAVDDMKLSCDSSYAHLFTTNLLSIMEVCENKQRFEQYCHSLCDQVVSLEKGWEILVEVFSVGTADISPGRDSEKEQLLCIIVSWMNNRTHGDMKCPILQVNMNLLGKASLSSAGFLKYYLSCLGKWSNCFHPCVFDVSGEIWRDSEGNCASLLSEHFQLVLKMSSGSMKSAALSCLCNNVTSSDFSVWRAVAKNLLISRHP